MHYECPRCGYSTQRKLAMKKHLYELKKDCPGQRHKIDLTPEIKEEILRDRVYQIRLATDSDTDKSKCMVNFSNCVFGMEATDKIDCVLSWGNQKLGSGSNLIN